VQSRPFLEQALEQAQQGDGLSALDTLDVAIETMQKTGSQRDIELLARTAAIISENVGQLERALRYWNICLENAPDNAAVHLALGDLLIRLGRYEQGRECHRSARELAQRHNAQDILEILQGRENG
jgi:tetratricopeptide (TPR) repeat protein